MLDLTPLNCAEVVITLNLQLKDFPVAVCNGHILCMSRAAIGFACSRNKKHEGPHVALQGHGAHGDLSIIEAWDQNGIIYRNIESCKRAKSILG